MRLFIGAKLARIRTIKPEFWKHEGLSELPEATHMLAAALLNYADDEGYFNANVKLIQGECFPLRELSVTVPVSLRYLSDIGYLQLGKGENGREYGRIMNFGAHQYISHKKPSKLKELQVDWTDSGKGTGKVRERSRPERNREQGKEQGKETTLSSKKETRPHANVCLEIIEDLNQRTGKQFKHDTKSTRNKILARLNEGFTIEDFKEVNRKMSKKWWGNLEFEPYLRPETLYAASHFDSYLNEPEPKRKGYTSPSKDSPEPTGEEKEADRKWLEEWCKKHPDSDLCKDQKPSTEKKAKTKKG